MVKREKVNHKDAKLRNGLCGPSYGFPRDRSIARLVPRQGLARIRAFSLRVCGLICL